MDHARSGRRLAALLRLADVVAATARSGAFEPQDISARYAARLVGRAGRLRGLTTGRMAKAIDGGDLAKRTKGAPLSEAELEQRRDAAKSNRTGAAIAGGAVWGLGGILAATSAHTTLRDAAVDSATTAGKAGFAANSASSRAAKAETKFRAAMTDRVDGAPMSSSRAVAVRKPADTVMRPRLKQLQDEIYAARSDRDAHLTLRNKAALTGLKQVRAARLIGIGLPVLATAAGALYGSHIAKAAPPRGLRKGLGLALNVASAAIPLVTETATGQRAMKWTAKKLGSAYRWAAGSRRGAVKVRRAARSIGNSVNANRASIAGAVGMGAGYTAARDTSRSRQDT